MVDNNSICKMTKEEWQELLDYQMEIAEVIREDVKKSFAIKKNNSFSYKCCLSPQEIKETPKKKKSKKFSA